MFNVGAPEVLMLAAIAVIVFGPDKLPVFARKAAKAVRYVRELAGNAQGQLKKELGPDFDDLDFRDLNPKAFVQKHLLSDVEPIVSDVKKDLDGISKLGKETVTEATVAIEEAQHEARRKPAQPVSTGNGVTATVAPALDGPRITTPYDPDAT